MKGFRASVSSGVSDFALGVQSHSPNEYPLRSWPYATITFMEALAADQVDTVHMC